MACPCRPLRAPRRPLGKSVGEIKTPGYSRWRASPTAAARGYSPPTNLLGAVAVAFTLIVNLARGYPLIAIAGTVLVASVLYWRWVRAGRPRGIDTIERQAESET